MITEYQQKLRERYLAATVMPAPAPWQPVLDSGTPSGGLLGIGFAVHPDSGHDLVMVVSSDSHGLFDAVTGEKIARDRDPDPERFSYHSMPCAIGRSSWASSLRAMYGSAIRMPTLRSNRRCPWCCDVESPEPALTASDLHVVMCCAMCTFTCTPC